MAVWGRRIVAACVLVTVLLVLTAFGFRPSYTWGEAAAMIAAYEIIQIGIWVDEEERLDNEESA